MEKLSVFMPGLDNEGSKLAAQKAMHSQYVLQLLHLQRRAGFLCDVTVNIEDKSFKAHKPLLAACSLYFRALFAEAESANTSMLNLTKLTAGGFEVLLDYIYSGSLAITAENSDQVLYAANCLQMTNVVETCLNFIRSSFQVSVEKKALGMEVRQPTSDPGTGMIQASHTPQENLQIVSTSSIQETDFNKIEHQSVARPGGLAQGNQFVQVQGGQMSQIPFHGQQMSSTPETQQDSYPVSQPMQSTNMECSVPYPQPPFINNGPTSETLSHVMPYLVAQNARRPTLSEVRQLLLNNHQVPRKEENQERFTLKQAPPALISSQTANDNETHAAPTQMSLHTSRLQSVAQQTQKQPVSASWPIKELPPVMMTHPASANSMVAPESVACNTTNETTAHTEKRYIMNNLSHLKAREMQPFVLINSDPSILPKDSGKSYNLQPDVDSSKGLAWSEDRSGYQDSTDLSGTPCDAGLTAKDNSPVACTATSPSPLSLTCSPCIQISPASTPTKESDASELISPKSRWCRTFSLDYSRPEEQNAPLDRHTSRSVGSKPLNFTLEAESPPGLLQGSGGKNKPNKNNPVVEIPHRLASRLSANGSVNNMISVEQATNAVGALFVGSNAKDDSSQETHLSANLATTSVGDQEEAGEMDSCNVAKIEPECVSDAFPVSGSESVNEKGNGGESGEDQHDREEVDNSTLENVKVEPDMNTSSISPPPEDSFTSLEEDVEMEKTKDDVSASTSPIDSEPDDNMALDLSMPKRGKMLSVSPLSNIPSTDTNGMVSPGGASVGANGLDALEMQTQEVKTSEANMDSMLLMHNSLTTACGIQPQTSFMSPWQSPEENLLNSGFSRKPRRSSGGQTCQWPGCGRLFRHKNIYNEHQKLHEMGFPVTQLRKCYMGARVKKTARERLQEMRMVDNSEGALASPQEEQALENGDGVTNSARPRQTTNVRRRKGVPHPRESSDRKRVTPKDRKDHYIARNQSWQRKGHADGDTLQQQTLQKTTMPPMQVGPPVVNQNGTLVTIPQQLWQANQVYFTTGDGGHILSQTPLQSTANLLSVPMVQQLRGKHPAIPRPPFVPNNDQQILMMPASVQQNTQLMHQLSQQHGANNSVVAATLADLGIQFPAKRGSDDPRLLAHGGVGPDQPPPAMTLDELRKRIAMRDNGNPVSINNSKPPNYASLVPTTGDILATAPIALMKQPISTLMRSPLKPGNVTGTKTAAEKNRIMQTTMSLPVPHQYHGQSAPAGHGPMCS